MKETEKQEKNNRGENYDGTNKQLREPGPT
jgi:hypothetical protein